jgi:hypothetical protein
MLRTVATTVVTAVLLYAPEQGRAPLTLIESARLDPESFSRALAAARVPAGLEVREADRAHGPYQQVASAEPSVPLRELFVEFNTANPAYRVTASGKAIEIAPATSRARYLDAPAPPGRLVVTGIMTALRKLFAPLDQTLSPTGGIVGSQLGTMDIGDQIKVDIEMSGLSVRECLVRLSVLAPGHVWIVVTSGTEPRIDQIGLLHADGSGTYLRIAR